MPTAYRADFRNVLWSLGCGGLRCAVGGAFSLRGGPATRLVMRIAARFSMRFLERRNPSP